MRYYDEIISGGDVTWGVQLGTTACAPWRTLPLPVPPFWEVFFFLGGGGGGGGKPQVCRNTPNCEFR